MIVFDFGFAPYLITTGLCLRQAYFSGCEFINESYALFNNLEDESVDSITSKRIKQIHACCSLIITGICSLIAYKSMSNFLNVSPQEVDYSFLTEFHPKFDSLNEKLYWYEKEAQITHQYCLAYLQSKFSKEFPSTSRLGIWSWFNENTDFADSENKIISEYQEKAREVKRKYSEIIDQFGTSLTLVKNARTYYPLAEGLYLDIRKICSQFPGFFDNQTCQKSINYENFEKNLNFLEARVESYASKWKAESLENRCVHVLHTMK